MSVMSASRFGAPWVAARPLIKGVCAELAARATVPVWIVRTSFLVFGLLHWVWALLAYFLLTRLLCRRARDRWTYEPAAVPATSPAGADMRSRFSALDARLAELEAATLQGEAALRRQFRDLR